MPNTVMVNFTNTVTVTLDEVNDWRADAQLPPLESLDLDEAEDYAAGIFEERWGTYPHFSDFAAESVVLD